MPEGITFIGPAAFMNCTSLALTSLPSGLAIIGHHHVFYGCHLSLGAETSSRTVSLTPLADSISRLRLGRLAAAVPTVTANRARRERKKALEKANHRARVLEKQYLEVLKDICISCISSSCILLLVPRKSLGVALDLLALVASLLRLLHPLATSSR